MNRIILIGNGFDLAHGLPTSYADFIDYYWEKWGKRLQGSYLGNELTDRLCSISQKGAKTHPWYYLFPTMDLQAKTMISPKDAIAMAKNSPDAIAIKKSHFFEHIDKAVETKNWVDIENEFYLWLKKIFKKDTCQYDSPVPLNDELELIKEHLADYLKFIQSNHINPELIMQDIKQIIREPFSFRDIAVSKQSQFLDFIINKWVKKNEPNQISEDNKSNRTLIESISKISTDQIVDKHKVQLIEDITKGKESVCKEYALPERTLLLNFNYTKTADLYIPKNSDIQVNHIHGELDNDKNPIIFGYGDELDDYYKEIAKLNDNDYLKNIKSIRYLETDNYRRLLSFIDSAPFQIYIMGHSCGNSDRTLLNTLFEHKNCVSIKPFYYQKDDGSDNYIELIQNISRNFNDMRLMRDRVVNKSYCRPLVPAGC